MKKLFPLLLCLLLCGCTQQAAETEPSIPEVTAVVSAEVPPVYMYDSDHPLEAQTHGALKVYPLTMRKVQGIQTMNDHLLVFSGYGSTTISVLTGPDLQLGAERTLNFELHPGDPSVQVHENAISFFDPVTRETVLLDQELKDVRRIAANDNITGSPILSGDQTTLYYCTSYAIRAWNLETGIHRTLKELSHESQTLAGLHCNDTVLQCNVRDGSETRQLFLSTETGQLLSEQAAELSLDTQDQLYYTSLPVSALTMHIFSDPNGTANVLYPKDWNAEVFWLPSQHAAVTASVHEDRIDLHHYSLQTGLLDAEQALPALQYPKCIASTGDGAIFLLTYDPARDCDTLYRWDISNAEATDTNVYTEVYSSSQNPAALSACQAHAARLSEAYGIQIRIGENALTSQPWDYSFEAEYLITVLSRELSLLEQRLNRYPREILEQTMSHFTSLNLCLVRQISGTAASGSLNTATGIQFLDGTDAYVAIAVGKYAEQALYHELFHVMETHILNESAALDQWEALNPDSFTYSYGYGTPEEYQQYLEGEGRSFVDSYSISFPKEDRARIFENAMLSGNEALFEAPVLQAKLTMLCESIREAYRLRKSPETFPWEQYLEKSLAWTES